MFIPEYAAYLVNRLEVGHDGKVAYERVKGKKPTILGVEFGEKLVYKLKPKHKLEKINPRWAYGISVGVQRRSGEVWIAINDTIVCARSVRRIPVEQRWCDDCVKWVSRVPCNRYKEALDADGALPEVVPAEDDRPTTTRDLEAPRIAILSKDVAPRGLVSDKIGRLPQTLFHKWVRGVFQLAQRTGPTVP